MKDHIKGKLGKCTQYSEVKAIIDDWMDYYNNERYQWKLAKLSPNEYYEYIKTGIYPLKGYTLEMINNMMDSGLSKEQISEMTKLSRNQIEILLKA